MLTLQELGLGTHSEDVQYVQYLNALNTFVDTISTDKNISQILLCGSFLLGTLDKNSDIDLFVVHSDVSDPYLESSYIDSIEIEQLILTTDQLEEKLFNKHDAYLDLYIKSVAESVIIYGDNSLGSIIKKAKTLQKN